MKLQPWQTAYNLLNKKVERFYPSFQELHIQLKKGGVLIAYKAYVAFMVFISLIAFVASFAVSLIILPFAMNIPLALSLLASVVIAASTALLSMLVMYFYPVLKASNRKGPIDRNLPYITSFLTLLSSSNVPPSTIFRSMAKVDTLSEVRLEFGNIVRDIEVFGSDLMSSINENAKLAASGALGEVLIGYVATVRTGGNPTEYLKVTSEKITKERMSKLDVMLESLSAMAEIYIMLLVAAPLLFVILFVTLGMIGGGAGFAGMSMSTILYLLTYIGIPLMGTTMIVLISTIEK
jgi:flagellar protein FlaJ